jgi:hypothetical protein
MGCFSLGWVEQLCIDLVIICAIIAIIKLLIPLLVGLLSTFMPGGAAIIGQILMIVLWAIVCIFVIYIIFGLLSCLVGSGGFHVGSFR